jgi:predicted lactoylglutathione lyase
MKNSILIIVILAAFTLGYMTRYMVAPKSEETVTTEKKDDKKEKEAEEKTDKKEAETPAESDLKVGAFSLSLNVKDLEASKKFYEALGFKAKEDMDISGGYLIMKNGNALIGIFKGFFEGSMITFNPGWDENAKEMEKWNDVREIQKSLKAAGYKLDTEADEKTTGPAYITLKDPDGNVILVDQHR